MDAKSGSEFLSQERQDDHDTKQSNSLFQSPLFLFQRWRSEEESGSAEQNKVTCRVRKARHA